MMHLDRASLGLVVRRPESKDAAVKAVLDFLVQIFREEREPSRRNSQATEARTSRRHSAGTVATRRWSRRDLATAPRPERANESPWATAARRHQVPGTPRTAEGARSILALNEELNQGNEDIRRILLAEVAGMGQLYNGPIRPNSFEIGDLDRRRDSSVLHAYGQHGGL